MDGREGNDMMGNVIPIITIVLAAVLAGFGPLIHKPLADKIERWCETKFDKQCSIENCRIIAGGIIAIALAVGVWSTSML